MATNLRRRAGVAIKPIENREELHTTFTKRWQGPFKKAATGGVIAFSSSGNVYLQEDPEFDPLSKRYLPDPSSSVAAANSGVDGGEITAAKMSPIRRRESVRNWGRGGYGEFGGGGCKSYEKRGEDA